MLPTHFFVAMNDSKVGPQAIKELTYDMCHLYFNWAGAIKVPAPCMYAHKIAKLFMFLGKECKNKKLKKEGFMLNEELCDKLHFL